MSNKANTIAIVLSLIGICLASASLIHSIRRDTRAQNETQTQVETQTQAGAGSQTTAEAESQAQTEAGRQPVRL